MTPPPGSPRRPQVRLLATQLAAPVPGGTGRYTEQLWAALVAGRPADAELTAWWPTRRPPPSLTDPSGGATGLVVTPRVPVPYRALARLWEIGSPPYPAADGVVHAPTVLVPPRRRSRCVVTVHDVVPWTHPETLTPRGVRFHHRMGARIAAAADLVVTPTEAVAEQVRRLLTPRAPVVSVHSGVTPLVPPADAAARRLRLGVTGDYVLFVGTAEPRKGLDVLVEAMAAPDLLSLSLVVAGAAGWGDVDVADLAARAGVRSRAVVTGRLSDADLAAVYAGATVLAMPSRAEGFGFPVLEAMGHAVPVVTSDDPALVEVGGGAAAIVPVGDARALAEGLAAAALDPRRRAELSNAGPARAAQFSWAKTAAAMWSLYAEVADRG